MAESRKTDSAPEDFQSIHEQEVPRGREGKHKRVVTRILDEVERLAAHRALKIPLSALPDSKENIRAALSRAVRQRGVRLATSSDSTHLYVWKVNHKS